MAHPPQEISDVVHASCVTLEGQGALIMGASGTGKSGLALQLMAMGADLVADDRTVLTRCDAHLVASAPDTIQGQIEARFVGILASAYVGPTQLGLVVTLDETEQSRLPEQHMTTLLGVQLPLIRRSETPHFAAAIHAWLKGTRLA